MSGKKPAQRSSTHAASDLLRPSDAVVRRIMKDYFPEDVLRDLDISRLRKSGLTQEFEVALVRAVVDAERDK